MIEPTVGRIVLFHPHPDDGGDVNGQPHAAIVAHVLGDREINLTVFNENGSVYSKQNVPLVQDGDVITSPGGYAEWMPYQKGQAQKTEAAVAAGAIDPVSLLAPAHERIAEVEAATQNKFEELGAWFTKTLREFETRLAAATNTPPAPPSPAPQGQA